LKRGLPAADLVFSFSATILRPLDQPAVVVEPRLVADAVATSFIKRMDQSMAPRRRVH
jgi:hypothetical protein